MTRIACSLSEQTHGCFLWSSGQPLVSMIPQHLWACPRRRCCGRLPVAPTRAPLARCRWLRPRHLAREAPRLCLVETVLLSPDDVLPRARSSRCSTSFQSMKRQPAARCCGLSAFCAAVCTNESSNCQSTVVVESRLTRLDSTSKKNSAKCFGHLLADRALEGPHVRSVPAAVCTPSSSAGRSTV